MNNIKGHALAILTVVLWGTTFVSTKLLLIDFTPIEILFCRFTLGIVALCLIYPHRLKNLALKQEINFAGAGLCGVTLYFLLENIALTYTQASNAALITATAPLFTMIAAYLFLKEEPLKPRFFIGFVVSMSGIALISFNGSQVLQLNPMGDFLALMAALSWAGYCVFTRKIGAYGYNTIQTTRRIFAYGLFFMLFAVYFMGFRWQPALFFKPLNLINILFLGLGASALCFVTWNLALRQLGAITTTLYIYLMPVITVISAMLILHERLTWMSGCGIILTLGGLAVTQIHWRQ